MVLSPNEPQSIKLLTGKMLCITILVMLAASGAGAGPINAMVGGGGAFSNAPASGLCSGCAPPAGGAAQPDPAGPPAEPPSGFCSPPEPWRTLGTPEPAASAPP